MYVNLPAIVIKKKTPSTIILLNRKKEDCVGMKSTGVYCCCFCSSLTNIRSNYSYMIHLHKASTQKPTKCIYQNHIMKFIENKKKNKTKLWWHVLMDLTLFRPYGLSFLDYLTSNILIYLIFFCILAKMRYYTTTRIFFLCSVCVVQVFIIVLLIFFFNILCMCVCYFYFIFNTDFTSLDTASLN